MFGIYLIILVTLIKYLCTPDPQMYELWIFLDKEYMIMSEGNGKVLLMTSDYSGSRQIYINKFAFKLFGWPQQISK